MFDFKNFFGVAPTDQNALDVFAGEWSSSPLAARAGLKAGTTPLFDDPRIQWAHDRFGEMGLAGGFTGRDVLELGPLEGGHTYLIDRFGAKSVTAVEASARLPEMPHREGNLRDAACAFSPRRLPCPPAHDRPHLRIGVACGILYHLTNPVELLELLARRCRAIYLWTVFYDPVVHRETGKARRAFLAGAANGARRLPTPRAPFQLWRLARLERLLRRR